MNQTRHKPGTSSTLAGDGQSPVLAGRMPPLSGDRRPPIRLLSPEDAARYLACSVWTVRERIWSGQLPVVRIGRLTRLDLNDLNEWIDAHKERRHG